MDVRHFDCNPPHVKRTTIHPDPNAEALYKRTSAWLSDRVGECAMDIVFVEKTLTKWPDERLGLEGSNPCGTGTVYGYKWTFRHRREGWIYCVHSNHDPVAFRAELHHADRIRGAVDRAAEILQQAAISTRCTIQ